MRPGAEARLRFAVGLGESARGEVDPRTRFELALRDPAGPEQVLWKRRLAATERGRFLDVELPLEKWSGQTIELVFRSCGEDGEGEEQVWLAAPWLDVAPQKASAAPSVLIVLVDTLRADALGCYGNERGLSPELDALAASGALYAQARSACSWTLPSIASLFTSLLPTQHSVAALSMAIAPQLETLAEVLAAGGWRTAAFTDGGFVSPGQGLEQGFRRFDARRGGVEVVTRRALEWIASSRAPFLAFVHTYEVHDPYDPPEPFRSRFVRPAEGAIDASGAIDTTTLMKRLQEGWKPTPQELRCIRDLYDAGVAYTDRVLGDFFAALRERGRWDDTLVIVTSDHGEEFFEHSGFGHAHTLYEEQLRIPLILRGPGIEAGRRVETPVRLIDLAPTILEHVDLAVPQGWAGRSLSDLQSPRDLFAARLSGKDGRDIYAVLEGASKSIWSGASGSFGRERGKAERYELELDPGEQENLFDESRRAPLIALLKALRERYGDRSGGGTAAAQLSQQALEHIRALGY